MENQMTNEELEKCINEYGKDIYSFCRHITCNEQEADDLYQDAFLKAVELQEKLDVSHNPKSYILSITLRLWKNRKRKYAWRQRIANIKMMGEEKDFIHMEQEETSLEEEVLRKDRNAQVVHAVQCLPDKLSIIVLLYYMEDLSVEEIAKVVKIPQGTVKSRLYQARKRLKKELEDALL